MLVRTTMEIFIFARFHALPNCEAAAEAALLEVLQPTREERGCLAINAFQSTTDPRLFYIHSRWSDEAAFEVHARLAHTVNFIERMKPLIDHPLDVTRAEVIG